ncbi:hypothetical protein NW768_007028 [Fusarium equiseti]|uniref:CCHC-type domain-containing protein n=1 Tax=Fusarium equiseti TaxID=61235 RepID=A0ABQ8RA44_FUSEQ|nr:hypothetical protein NW768_007028 [Fusarium equiseti]
MSYNKKEVEHAVSKAVAAALMDGALGGGRRGGRGGGGGRGGIQKDTKTRCYRCRSTQHLIGDYPHKDESRRQVRKRLQEARSAQEALPAPAPAFPPPAPPAVAPDVALAAVPVPVPAPAAPTEQPPVSF